VTSATSAAMSGGVIALPKREKEWVMPWARPKRARRGRKGGALAEAEGETRRQQRDEAARRTGHHRRGADDEAADAQRAAGAEAVAEPAADELEQRVRIGEGREDKAELGVAEAELGFDQRRRRRDVDPIDIEDEIHQAEQQQDLVRHGRPQGVPESGGDRHAISAADRRPEKCDA
jgi:hypothetical protein